MSGTLAALAQALSDGAVRVVDLTATLSPDTVVIDLPPIFAASPGLSMDLISQYDDNGPAWYWNTITLGEHTGTHFDAPVHWVTGKDLPDNATDTLPPSRFVGPACVVDVTREAAADNDFLLTPEFLLAWEEKHGRIPAGAWLLMRSGWSKRTGKAEFLNIDENGSHTPGPSPDCV
ncbi:MAG: cyclase family protein, partial [Anaerolineales bacterium]|nr:cyclase family protein [Anaerolineales bacterium]